MGIPSRRLFAACGVSVGILLRGLIDPSSAAPPKTVVATIGAKAPVLAIEHWVQDGGGTFEPVTTFENGTVYVIQFWQSWSVSCTKHLAHVARVQAEWADRNVQVIGVSDEPLDDVLEFLRRDDGRGETFADLTRGFRVTTDPDGSVHNDYLGVSSQDDDPTPLAQPVTFIVGKTGDIEWVGHPMEMEEPLGKIVGGTWAQNRFLDEEREFGAAEKKLSTDVHPLVRAGRYHEADSVLAVMMDESRSPKVKAGIVRLRRQFDGWRIGTAMQEGDGAGASAVEAMAAEIGDDAARLDGLASLVLEMHDAFPTADRLLEAATAAAEKASGIDPANAGFLHTLARLHRVAGRIEEADAIQRRADAHGGPEAETTEPSRGESEAQLGE